MCAHCKKLFYDIPAFFQLHGYPDYWAEKLKLDNNSNRRGRRNGCKSTARGRNRQMGAARGNEIATNNNSLSSGG